MPSTFVEHSLHTRRRHCTQTPMASRCRWFSQVATETPTPALYHAARRGCCPRPRTLGREIVAPILIVKTGTTVPDVARRRRDFETWISEAMHLDDGDVL